MTESSVSDRNPDKPVANIAVVVTTIARPTPALVQIQRMVDAKAGIMLVVGDKKTPEGFDLRGAHFMDVCSQLNSTWQLARKLGFNHYARKNLGYLEAISRNATLIIETDDDNFPQPSFLDIPGPIVPCRTAGGDRWINAYRYFTDRKVWPRGFPLDHVLNAPPVLSNDLVPRYCPIQQSLADGDTDVDAIYRMTVGHPVVFEQRPPVALTPGSICPINSQNTAWWPEAYPLLYLPSNCSFRMTDIWRGFVAFRIAAAQGWHILFHSATTEQERNPHDLVKDFEQEVDGYLKNAEFVEILAKIKLPTGREVIPESILLCYEALCKARIFPHRELDLVRCWISDIDRALGGRR